MDKIKKVNVVHEFMRLPKTFFNAFINLYFGPVASAFATEMVDFVMEKGEDYLLTQEGQKTYNRFSDDLRDLIKECLNESNIPDRYYAIIEEELFHFIRSSEIPTDKMFPDRLESFYIRQYSKFSKNPFDEECVDIICYEFFHLFSIRWAEKFWHNEMTIESFYGILRNIIEDYDKRFKKIESMYFQNVHSDVNQVLDFKKKWNDIMFLEDRKRDDVRYLKDLYVLPDYEIWENTYGFDAKLIRKSNLDEVMESYITYNDSRSQIQLILGSPGIGKSTFLIWLINQPFLRDKDIHLFRFADAEGITWAQQSGKRTVQEMLSYMGFASSDELDGKVIIWDGYDEISVSEEQRIRLLKAIGKLWGSRCRVIITCRENYISNVSQLEQYIDCYFLKPFTRDLKNDHNHDQIRLFAQKYQGRNDNESDISKNLEILLDSNNNDMEEIVGIPLILYMILSVAMVDPSFIRNSTDIYLEIFKVNGGIYDKVLKNRQYDDAMIEEDRIEIKEAMQKFSQEIAYEMFINNSQKCSIVKANLIINSLQIKKDLSSILSESFFRTNMKYAEVNHSNGMIEFVHRSLYEYFAALKIYNDFIDELEQSSNVEKFYDNNNHIIHIMKRLSILFRWNIMSEEIINYLSSFFEIHQKESLTLRNILNDQDLWEKIFITMLEFGMIHDDKANDQIDISGNTFSERVEKELVCFENIIKFIQMIRGLALWEKLFLENTSINIRARLEFYLRVKYCEKLNLSKFNLSFLDLSRTNMNGYKFVGCDLTGTCFNEASLVGADFSDSILEMTDLNNSRLVLANIDKRKVLTMQGFNKADFVWDKPFNNHRKQEIISGNLIEFGRFPQDIEGNIWTSILWRILDVDMTEKKALLLADQILFCDQYHHGTSVVSWEKCDLRHKLNNEFYKNPQIFTESQRARICGVNHCSEVLTDSKDSAVIYDYVFLLNLDEMIKYFADGKSEMQEQEINKIPSKWYIMRSQDTVVTGTDYARNMNNKKLYVNAKTGNSVWWLRGGKPNYYYVRVATGGDVFVSGHSVSSDEAGVRPALWIFL